MSQEDQPVRETYVTNLSLSESLRVMLEASERRIAEAREASDRRFAEERIIMLSKYEENKSAIKEVHEELKQTKEDCAEAISKADGAMQKTGKLEETIEALQEGLKEKIIEEVNQAIEPHIQKLGGDNVALARLESGVSRALSELEHLKGMQTSQGDLNGITEQRLAQIQGEAAEAVSELRQVLENEVSEMRVSFGGDLDRIHSRIYQLTAIERSEVSSDEGLAYKREAQSPEHLGMAQSSYGVCVPSFLQGSGADLAVPPEPPDPRPAPTVLFGTNFKTPSVATNMPTGNEIRARNLDTVKKGGGTFGLTQVPLTPDDPKKMKGRVRIDPSIQFDPDKREAQSPEHLGVAQSSYGVLSGLYLDPRIGGESRRTTPGNGAGVVVNITRIPQGNMLRKVTLKSLKWLLDKVYAEYLRTSIDATFSLVDHISEEVLMLLVADMRRKGHPLSKKVNMRNIYRVASDDLITSMLMEFARPKSRGEYEAMMYAAVTQFPKNRSAEFVSAEYDNLIAPTVDKIVEEVQLYHSYMTWEISEEQKLYLPTMKWGDVDSERSLIQIAMQCLEPYANQFKSIINSSKDGSKLKTIGSLAVWGEIILKYNDQYANIAIETRRADALAKPTEKASVIQSKARDLSIQESFIKGKGERHEFEAKKKSAEGDLHRMEYEHYGYGFGGSEGYELEEQQRLPRGGDAQLRAFDWENPRHPEKGPQPVRGPQRAPVRGVSYGGREGGRAAGRISDMRGGHGGRGVFGPRPPPGRGGRGPPPAQALPLPARDFTREFTPERPLVCYKFAFGNCDKGRNCEYAHDPELARKYVVMKAQYFMDSKFYPAGSKVDVPRLSLFTVPEREEEDWYEFQRMVLEEELVAAHLEPEQGDYGEEHEEDEGVVDGYGAHHRS